MPGTKRRGSATVSRQSQKTKEVSANRRQKQGPVGGRVPLEDLPWTREVDCLQETKAGTIKDNSATKDSAMSHCASVLSVDTVRGINR